MTREEYAQVMALVVAYWPHWSPHPETFQAGERLLLDLDAQVVAAAIDALAVEEPDFAPGAGKIRARAVAMTHPTPDVDQAWAEVLVQIRKTGHYRKPEWSTPVISTAVDSIGWVEICMTDNVEATRAHFFRLFESARKRAKESALPESVLAVIEAGRVRTPALEEGGDDDGDRDRDPDHDPRRRPGPPGPGREDPPEGGEGPRRVLGALPGPDPAP